MYDCWLKSIAVSRDYDRIKLHGTVMEPPGPRGRRRPSPQVRVGVTNETRPWSAETEENFHYQGGFGEP
jgi:hypothetical protein